MTCIAWDGHTLAADRRVTSLNHKAGEVTKIHRWKGGLCGFAGQLAVGAHLIAWLKAGAVPSKFPVSQMEEKVCDFMVITLDGRVMFFESEPIPYILENQQHAIGSGAEYAMAAMYLGHPAPEAVEVAIALDTGCGNGIDTLTLIPGKRRK